MQTPQRYALTLTHMAYSTHAMTLDPEGAWVRSDEVDIYIDHLKAQLEQQKELVRSTLREHAQACNILVDVAARCPSVVE